MASMETTACGRWTPELDLQGVGAPVQDYGRVAPWGRLTPTVPGGWCRASPAGSAAVAHTWREKLGPLRAVLWDKRVQDGEVRAFYTHGNCGSITFDLVRRSIIRRVGSRRESVGAVFLTSWLV